MEDQGVKVKEQGTIKVKYTTAMILGAIIFLASLFSGWITQSHDIGRVQADQKEANDTLKKNTNRITAVEECIKSTKEDMAEVKGDIKEINKGQREIMGILIGIKKEVTE